MNQHTGRAGQAESKGFLQAADRKLARSPLMLSMPFSLSLTTWLLPSAPVPGTAYLPTPSSTSWIPWAPQGDPGW